MEDTKQRITKNKNLKGHHNVHDLIEKIQFCRIIYKLKKKEVVCNISRWKSWSILLLGQSNSQTTKFKNTILSNV